jgi:hypothetical protein
MDECLQSGSVYIQKDDIIPACGFFLVDFKTVRNEPQLIRKILDDMQIETAYIENSVHFPIADAELLFDGLDITLVNFAAGD